METRKIGVFRKISITGILVLVLAIISITALRIGTVKYSTSEILAIFAKESSTVKTIVLNLRLPRVILGIIIGMCLAVSGSILQAIMHNPLADPGIIGVSSGASVAATAIILIFPNLTSSLPLFAFAGAAISCVLIYTLAWSKGIDPVRIVLAGVAINTIFGGITSMFQLLNTEDLGQVLAWLNGSLSGKSWNEVRVLSVYAIIGLTLAMLSIKGCNALQLGDEMAKNLGINVNFARVALSAIAAFLAAATVAMVGMIGFVGLIVPHIARMLVGSDYKIMMPTGMLLGSIVVVFADTVGRTAFGILEVPLGIVMAVLGGPFFLYLLRKGGQSYGS